MKRTYYCFSGTAAQQARHRGARIRISQAVCLCQNLSNIVRILHGRFLLDVGSEPKRYRLGHELPPSDTMGIDSGLETELRAPQQLGRVDF